MNELEIQTQLIKALKDAGGYGWKTDHKHMAGLPDLTMAHPYTGGVYIEVKLLAGDNNIVLVSPIQTETIKRMQAAGFNVGVAAIKRLDVGVYEIYVTYDPSKVRLDNTFIVMLKTKGGIWPILSIMQAITMAPGAHAGHGVAVSDGPRAASERPDANWIFSDRYIRKPPQ